MASKRLLMVVIFCALSLVPKTWARSGKEYKFRGGVDGSLPESGLVSDGAGNFYGTTSEGGRNSSGAVLEFSLGAGGNWTKTVIYNFTGGADGTHPMGNLVFDDVGNLYGTTEEGGAGHVGTVFKLSPSQGETWTETVIYAFAQGAGGYSPFTGVTFDREGNLYGTTLNGGICSPYCGGTVFELSPSEGGTWVESTLYSFPASQNGDAQPSALILDAFGNLYGTLVFGGSAGWGAVFELTHNQDGNWTENILYNFTGKGDGGNPPSGVTFDTIGNLYGEAALGGYAYCLGHGCGVIFELAPSPTGWKETTLHTFVGQDGAEPWGGLIFDSKGNLFGTTALGGRSTCPGPSTGCGVIFKLSPAIGGGMSFALIAAFNYADGLYPLTGVIEDAAGNLYGTTNQGGDPNCGALYGCGVVFTLTP